MKVYFTASITGKKHYLNFYEEIARILRKNGCEVRADHILTHNESEIRMETKEDRVKFHKQLSRWIREADCMVVEASFPSISVGYEISLAINNHKPVLLLYTEGDPPSLLDNCHADEVVCERYGMSSLREVVEGFLDYVKNREERRFTFYITPEIMAHLDQIVREKKLPKAVYLRQLIEKDMGY